MNEQNKKTERAHLYLGAEGAAGTDNVSAGAVGTAGLLAVISNNLEDSFTVYSRYRVSHIA